jgi:hypothetical protein
MYGWICGSVSGEYEKYRVVCSNAALQEEPEVSEEHIGYVFRVEDSHTRDQQKQTASSSCHLLLLAQPLFVHLGDEGGYNSYIRTFNMHYSD